VSRDTDISVRTFLAQRGMKKGDLSKFIEKAVKCRVLDQTRAEARDKFADMPANEAEALIDEAVAVTRATSRSRWVTVAAGHRYQHPDQLTVGEHIAAGTFGRALAGRVFRLADLGLTRRRAYARVLLCQDSARNCHRYVLAADKRPSRSGCHDDP
jgi:hypothetical protein